MKTARLLISICCLAAVFVVGASGGAGKTSGLVEVKVCPMQGEAVDDPHAASEVVGRYKVYFCCASCMEPFDKLSAGEKERRIHAALKKQEAGR